MKRNKIGCWKETKWGGVRENDKGKASGKDRDREGKGTKERDREIKRREGR